MPSGVVYPTIESAQEYGRSIGASPKDIVPVEGGFSVAMSNVDELGYMHGGMPKMKPKKMKFSRGGAIKGTNFSGTY
jgi:hypothetical protein